MKKIIGVLIGALAFDLADMIVGSFADSQASEIGAGFLAGVIISIVIFKSNRLREDKV